MRERGQASVEAIALIAVALALATALLLAIAGFAPALTSTLVRALSGVVAPRSPSAPRLDGLESALLAAATSPDADAPTLLDVRTHLRSRLGQSAGDAAFAAVLRPLVDQALPEGARELEIEAIGVTDATAEAAWLRTQLHPDLWLRGAEAAVGWASVPGGIYSLGTSLGLLGGDQPDAIAPGEATGDVAVILHGDRTIILRRREGKGLTRISDMTMSRRAGPA
jgi:hypothetical protein